MFPELAIHTWLTTGRYLSPGQLDSGANVAAGCRRVDDCEGDPKLKQVIFHDFSGCWVSNIERGREEK
eukprot:1363505-Amorphochlora_amoeboformis.AAC.2